MKEGVQQLIKNPNNKKIFALDIHWKILQQKDKWFLITPLTVIQYNNYSDIEKIETDYKHLMLDLDKEWIYSKNNSLSSATTQPISSPLSTPPRLQIPNQIFHNMTYFCGK
jgi:hypothetical protein